MLKLILTFAICLGSLIADLAQGLECGVKHEPRSSRINGCAREDLLTRIINGQRAHPGQFPWQVGVYDNTGFLCGGAIYSETVIVTAAHCVVVCIDNKLFYRQGLRVAVGDTVRDPGVSRDGKWPRIKGLLIHPDYNMCSTDPKIRFQGPDLALFRVDKMNFEITSNGYGSVNKLCPPFSDYSNLEDYSVIVSGWGSEDPDQPPSINLNWGTFEVLSQESCVAAYEAENVTVTSELLDYNTQVCIFNPQIFNLVAQGDSGGPVIAFDSATRQYSLFGIITRTVPNKTVPCIVTRMSAFVDWIKDFERRHDELRRHRQPKSHRRLRLSHKHSA